MFCVSSASTRPEDGHGWTLFLRGRNGHGQFSQQFLDTGEGSRGKWHDGNLEFVRKRVDLTAPLVFLLILKEVWPKGAGSKVFYNLRQASETSSLGLDGEEEACLELIPMSAAEVEANLILR